MSTARGTTTAQQTGFTIKYTSTGKELARTYEGRKAEVDALVDGLLAQGFEVEYTEDRSPMATLRAVYPADTYGATGTITDTNNVSGLFTTGAAHELTHGDAITIADIVGISSSTTYFIYWVSSTTFYLYSNFNLATKVYPTNNNDTGTFAKQESPTPRWELFSEVREVPVCDARYIDKLSSNLSDAQRAVLKKIIEGTTIRQAEADLFSMPPTHLALYKAVAYTKVQTISYDVPVITSSKTVTRGYGNSAAMTNAGKILTTSQMSSLEGMETGLLDGFTEFTSIAGTVIGWRKGFPRREALGGGRFAISQKFEYDWWCSALYVAA